MRSSLSTITVLGALFVEFASAISVQENYTICNWARLRAGVVRDALYLDGGLLWWQTAFADGTTPVVSSDDNAAGDMFRLNFSEPFDTTKTNLSMLFNRMPKAGGAGNNIAPNYVDGTMLTNNDELYLYGGLPRLTDSASDQSADSILGYEADQYGPYRSSWSPGFYQGTLPTGVTRYVTNGAGASVPSENLGFYFSGMRSPDWGPIHYEDSSANMSANTLIEVDMSVMRDEKWTNTTLPDNITPRANAELVWVPVSNQGVLVAIGGVTAPEEIWATGLNASQTSQSESESPTFMTELAIYDISSKSWYLQNTTGEAPGQLTEFCAVMAPAQDSSSFNIYVYGGYDGLNADDEPSDDVWILSVPSFHWFKAYSGKSSHGRSGHQCVMPYPNQMFVLGGMHQNQAECVEGGIIQVFDLNNLQFVDSYNPNVWTKYQVPSLVSAFIGGNSNGGSKKTAAWSDDSLAGIFGTQYKKSVTTYYPYKSSGSVGSSSSSGSSTTRTIAIAVGVAAGVVLLLLLLVLFLVLRRRRLLKSTNSSGSTTSDRSRVTRWLDHAALARSSRKSDPNSTPPEMQHINPGPGHEPSPSISSDSAAHNSQHQRQQPTHHEIGAGIERSKPPYELATPYNQEDQPRHSAMVDYAYSPSRGHGSHSHSNSDNSNSSSNYDGDSNSHLREPTLPHGFVEQRSSSGSAFTNPYRDDNSSTNTSSTLAWPLPSSQGVWRPPNSNPHPQHPDHETAPVPPIPSQYRNSHGGGTAADGFGNGNGNGIGGTNVRGLRPPPVETHGSDNSNSNQSSSGLDTLPSPEASLPQDEEYRRNLFGGVNSPVSPVEQNYRRM